MNSLRAGAWARPLERTAIAFGLGTAGLGVLTLVAGLAGLLNPWLFRVGLGLIALTGLGVSKPWKLSCPSINADYLLLTTLVVAPFLVIMLLGSMLPAIDFDVLEYHLQGPKEYYQAGRIASCLIMFIRACHSAWRCCTCWAWRCWPTGGGAGWWASSWWHSTRPRRPCSSPARPGERLAPTAAWFAAIVYLSTPWVYRLAVISYVEGPLCYYHAALLWAAIVGWTDRSLPRGPLWGLLGLLAGGAMACKYPALISAVIPFGLLALAGLLAMPLGPSARGLCPGLVDRDGALALEERRSTRATPFILWPIASLAARHWDEARELQWAHAHGPHPPTWRAFWSSLVDVAGRSDWQSPLYLAFAPLALLRPGSRKLVLALCGYAAYLFLTWWLLTHRLDRFWLPMLPCLAILAGLGADWTKPTSLANPPRGHPCVCTLSVISSTARPP